MAEHTIPLALNAGSVGLAPAQRKALAHIWAVLPHARLVGGVVRDLLAGRSVADVDIATPEPPEHVQAALEAAGIKVVPTGLAHGTVTAVIESAPYEITTLRQDTETDGRHAVVSWTQDWQQDAARRDFTINAMSRDKEGVLFDYFGGQADLQAGHVRFVGQAAQRIEEDALRILRFFRFQGRYGHGQPDVQAVTAIEQRTDLLKKLSVERVWSELQRLLVGPQAAQQVLLMARLGVLAAVFAQGVRVEHFAALVAVGAPPEPVLRLAGLIDG
ncbi:MAG: CCA tRNA nucleotidyltransferase, partial [Acetobacter sp.]|nr:CCA tRNA nucleotidyltransferase [Acetobacter sp.]